MKIHTAGVAVCIIIALLAIAAFIPLRYSSQTAAATSTITLTPSIQSAFPNSITFKIQADSGAVINQLRLHYVVEKQNYAEVVSEGWPVFTPAASVNTQWVWDMRKSPLPVGTTVEYWWTARDDAGHTEESDRYSFAFDDTLHNWKSMVEGPITLFWYDGDNEFADSLMAAARQGLETIENDIGIVPEGTVRIYIYGSQSDLLSSQLFAPDWQGGVTFQGYDVIAIGVSPGQLAFGLSATPHELTHWVMGHHIFNPYGAGLPVWLDEGLATYVQEEQYDNWLNYAITKNKLISVRTLSSPFSAIAEQAYISYAESQSIVTFLLSEYGKDKMAELFDAFSDGATDDAALMQVYGFDQDGLDRLWRQSIGVSTSP
ncbi:MAG: peptidase MA domain-containing protein [Dehalococcoidales bacterium]|nr:peptidase MA domain-containing protein [Dehalococcoidales bacterium]